MLILALDTTTRGGSCAVARDGVVLQEGEGDAARSHAERLPVELMAVLEAARVSLADVDLFAAATGPGSFTGLRVGIATMQGLAFAAGKPLVGISTLDALASFARRVQKAPPYFDPSNVGEGRSDPPSTASTIVVPLIDAWRGEVYAAVYERGSEMEPPMVIHPATLLERWRSSQEQMLFIGDGAATYRDLIAAMTSGRGHVAEPAAPALAGTVARLAAEAARRGELPPPHAIRPLYVRRTDAELARDARTAR
jgi:tRNA threonylcarbamoyladenosine biosynthesis protein TsaB